MHSVSLSSNDDEEDDDFDYTMVDSYYKRFLIAKLTVSFSFLDFAPATTFFFGLLRTILNFCCSREMDEREGELISEYVSLFDSARKVGY